MLFCRWRVAVRASRIPIETLRGERGWRHRNARSTSTSAYAAVRIMHFISSEMVDLLESL
jgi:hypothetical protein